MAKKIEIKAAHTPVPWALRKTAGYSCGVIRGSPGFCISGPKYTVFHLPNAGRIEPEFTADAEFVIRACNSHADLVAALVDCYDALCGCQATGNGLAAMLLVSKTMDKHGLTDEALAAIPK